MNKFYLSLMFLLCLSTVSQAQNKVGVNTMTPGSMMSVNGNAAIGTNYAPQAAPVDGAIIEGNVGIGVVNPTLKLEVSGDALINSITVGRGGGNDITNVANGNQALMSNTIGGANTAIGALTLTGNTSGGANTATGTSALESNTSGSFNTATGGNALRMNTFGQDNTAIGFAALYTNTSGAFNSATGFQALQFNTTGNSNTANGHISLQGNTTGEMNTAVGYGTLYYNTTGSSNTALGNNAGVPFGSGALTNATAIGADAVVGASNSLVLGNNAKVGIGTSTPSQKLEVVGTTKTTGFQMTNGAGATKVLQSDGVGNGTWVLPSTLGVTGPAGPQGPAGPTGATGATGATGPAGTYTAGTGIGIAGGVISNTGDISNTNEIELPTQVGNSGKVLSTNGTSPSWIIPNAGTVTSVTASNGLTSSGGATPAITLGGTLSSNTTIANAGFNLNFTGAGKLGVGTSTPTGLFEVNTPYIYNATPTNMITNNGTSYPFLSSVWQSFTATADGLLYSVDCNTAIGANSIISIYAGTGTGGTLLASEAHASNFATYAFGSPKVFVTPIPIQAGQVYTINFGGNGYYYYALDNYPGGTSSQAGYDIAFQVGYKTIIGGGVAISAIAGGNVGIGTTTPTQKLEVVGNIKTTNFQMTSGAGATKVLQSDGSGNATWVLPASLGVTGPAGATGPTGATGATGATGPAGSANISGTTDYVIKFTGANTGGNSTIQDNGTVSVGISVTPEVAHKLLAVDFDYTAATAYDRYGSRSALAGADFNVQVYEFGVSGHAYNDYTRCGGVLGAQWGGTYWGSLGYKNSASTTYGVYGSSAYANGAGYSESNEQAGIGAGFAGGVVGSWAKSNIIGTMSSGEMMSEYNVGDAYTVGRNIEVVKVGNTRKAIFASTALESQVNKSGIAQLVNGIANVSFGEEFASLLAEGQMPVVTVTPMGESKGVYLATVNKNGFSVKENQAGNSNVQFTWIVIGKRVDADQTPIQTQVLNASFEENMQGVMFDDNNKEQSATPIWFDGSSIRFDAIPAKFHPVKTEGTRKE